MVTGRFACVLAVAALVAGPLLAGCAEKGSDVPPVDGLVLIERFDRTGTGGPAGWRALDGDWALRHGDAAHADVMEGVGHERGRSDCLPSDPDGGYACLLAPAGSFADFGAQVTFLLVAPETDALGAGLVIHYQDERNFQIVRYSPHEAGWHLFTVRDGERTKHEEASTTTQTDVGSGEWIRMAITSQDGRIRVSHGDTQVIDHRLDEDDAHVGRVGLFLRGDTRAWFDSFAVAPLADGAPAQ